MPPRWMRKPRVGCGTPRLKWHQLRVWVAADSLAVIPQARRFGMTWMVLCLLGAIFFLQTPAIAAECDADTARDVTGYVRGTITPLGATTAWPVIADASIVGRRISVGGGAAGVGITVDADALIEALHADVADLMD